MPSRIQADIVSATLTREAVTDVVVRMKEAVERHLQQVRDIGGSPRYASSGKGEPLSDKEYTAAVLLGLFGDLYASLLVDVAREAPRLMIPLAADTAAAIREYGMLLSCMPPDVLLRSFDDSLVAAVRARGAAIAGSQADVVFRALADVLEPGSQEFRDEPTVPGLPGLVGGAS